MMLRGPDAGDTWSHHDIRDYAVLYNCRDGALDPSVYLPAGTTVQATGSSGFYRLVTS